jgi:hypothetical protein
MTGGPVTEIFFRARKLRAKRKFQCHPTFLYKIKSSSANACAFI